MLKLSILPTIAASLLSIVFITGCGSNGNDDSGQDSRILAEELYTYEQLKGMVEKPITYKVNNQERGERRVKVNNIGRYAEVFNDSNKYQYVFAEKYGLKPVEDLRGAYFTSRPVVKVADCDYYTVAKLTHSVPYLTPEAEMLLRLIGRNFMDSLAHRGADGYRIIATSMLRTPQAVKKLRRVNVNATDSSCHKFATTFDISHSKFACLDSTRTVGQPALKGILAEVLLDLRRQNLCMVKYEHKTACFHVTVTPHK